MQINIRTAVREDCTRLLELVRELAVYQKASPHDVTISESEFEACGFGTNPVWQAFVAEVNGRVEGYALYYIRFSTWMGRRLYLEDLYITENLRGRGAGKLLINRLVEEAREKGYSGIVWQVLNWITPALEFYKNLGATFDKKQVICSLEIKPSL
jgi:GNAT superfamily N-acetyltransferase